MRINCIYSRNSSLNFTVPFKDDFKDHLMLIPSIRKPYQEKQRIFKMDTGRVFKDVARVSEKSGKSRVSIFFDMLYCGLQYGAGPLDYELFEFYYIIQRYEWIFSGYYGACLKKVC